MNYKYPAARILIFARTPEPGKVKTRLVPAISQTAAAKLHERLTRHTVQMALASQLSPVELYCSPDPHHALFLELECLGVGRLRQTGQDLGERMYQALKASLTSCDRAVLVGTDCPIMDARYLSRALRELDHADAVLGPAEDGGYVLIGMRSINASLFREIDWGTDRVLQQTRHKLQSAGMHWVELETLWDIDREQDLRRWESELA